MRVNLIPMAGEGQRYVDAGYQIPKPFIEVDGLPMVFVRAKPCRKQIGIFLSAARAIWKNTQWKKKSKNIFQMPLLLP